MDSNPCSDVPFEELAQAFTVLRVVFWVGAAATIALIAVAVLELIRESREMCKQAASGTGPLGQCGIVPSHDAGEDHV